MSVHESVMKSMKQMADEFAKSGVALQLPPPSGETLGRTYVDVDPGKMLAAEFRFDRRFSNPLGMFQGGFLCAALDEV
ncbi:MAG: hypothetical protein P4M08_13310 [Oligoflexia bacterium]|nr:hypothetical protein [Oligoflexia bacterium]